MAASPVTADPRFSVWLMAALLVLATLMVYQPAWHGKPLWDDDAHLTKPGLRSLAGLVSIWTQPGATQQYYPLAFTAFWVQHKLWGDSTLGYHLVNIFLHALSALLFLRILRQLEVPGAWLAAAIFALHPVHVESVAWITELKNTLSGFFYLGSALAYLGFDRTRRKWSYGLALGLFVLGLLTKTAIAPLPAGILVVLWWKRGKLFWKRDVLPLLPFFLAGLAAGLVTVWAERKLFGAEGGEFEFSLPERCLIAGRSLWFHLGKLFWPANLSFMYSRWNISLTVWWQWLYPAGAVLLLAGLWALRRRNRGPLAGLLLFAGPLFPALGFFNAYSFRYSFVNDHHQYLASMGIIALVSAGAALRSGQWPSWGRSIRSLLCLPLLVTLATLTWRQCGIYADLETLYRATIARNPDCFMAHYNLGIALGEQGQLDQAISHYQDAIRLKPGYADAHNNLGNALSEQGQLDQAISHFQEAIRLMPGCADAHNNLGNALLKQGQIDAAIAHYQETIRLEPDHVNAHNNLGGAFFKKGRMADAIRQYQEAIRLKADYAEAHYNLGNALFNNNQTDAAIRQFREALRLRPDFTDARNNLDAALASQADSSKPPGASAKP
jgi:protein O-mannosyl-transferase